jgi:hypothetical protein
VNELADNHSGQTPPASGANALAICAKVPLWAASNVLVEKKQASVIANIDRISAHVY